MRSRDISSAVSRLGGAGDRDVAPGGLAALALGAPEHAATYLSRALEEEPERELRTTVLVELARAEGLARGPRSMEYYEEATRVSEDPVIRASAMIEMAAIMWYAGEVKRPLELLDRALVEVADHDEALMVRAETMRTAFTAYVPSLVDGFVTRLPRMRELATSARPGTRPLAMLLAGWGSMRDEPREGVRALVELGWDEGRYLAEATASSCCRRGSARWCSARSSIVQLRSSPQCAPRVERAGR